MYENLQKINIAKFKQKSFFNLSSVLTYLTYFPMVCTANHLINQIRFLVPAPTKSSMYFSSFRIPILPKVFPWGTKAMFYLSRIPKYKSLEYQTKASAIMKAVCLSSSHQNDKSCCVVLCYKVHDLMLNRMTLHIFFVVWKKCRVVIVLLGNSQTMIK